jgi:predicted metal-dependent phosphoesterase TrpH
MDCDTPLDKIITRCAEIGINCIAVSDHGTAEGALKIQSMAPFRVIVAEEILTPHGEIMGMFLKETIPSGLSVEETLSRIKAQGGLVCIPHPFDAWRQSALDSHILEKIVEHIDIIEVFNARAILQRYSNKALDFARIYSLPGSAGSDAHTLNEIGDAYVEIPKFNGKEDFLKALQEGKICGSRTSPLVHFNSTWTRLKKTFKR